MKQQLNKTLVFTLAILCGNILLGQNDIPYGNNPATGKFISINGVRHYYEVYGEGAPLLLIHGNRTGIPGYAKQIAYFAGKYRVYAIDCRGRGKSELGKDTLSFMQMAQDMSAFINLMQLDSVDVIGKSDGGIISLLMGIYYPAHIRRIVSFSANVSPDSTALYPETVAEIRSQRLKADSMLALKDTSNNWLVEQQRYRLMEFQPHIGPSELQRIKVPVLVISCDRDVIKEEHTFFIYRHIPFANLAILSGETHAVPKQNAMLFNTTVDRFLSQPFHGRAMRFNN